VENLDFFEKEDQTLNYELRPRKNIEYTILRYLIFCKLQQNSQIAIGI